MKTKNLALLGVSIICTLSACKKDDPKTTETPAEVSVVGTWKLTAQTATVNFGGQDTTIDSYANLEPCAKDNQFRLNADNQYTHLSGAIKCDPSEPTSFDYGSWVLLNNKTQIRIMTFDTTTSDILKLDNTTLKLKATIDGGGMPIVLRSTYSRQ